MIRLATITMGLALGQTIIVNPWSQKPGNIQTPYVDAGLVQAGAVIGGSVQTGSGNNETPVKDTHWARILVGKAPGTIASAGSLAVPNINSGSTCPASINNTLASGTNCVCGSASPQTTGCPDGGTLGSLIGISPADDCDCSIPGQMYFVDGGSSPVATNGLTCDCSVSQDGGVSVLIQNQSGGTICAASAACWIPISVSTNTR